MNDRTKKWVVILGLTAVCMGLIFGISRVLYREPDTETQLVKLDEEDTEITVDFGQEATGMQEDTEEGDTEEVLVIETETQTAVDAREQEIQKEPEKTENEKPSTSPALAEDADIENPETQPAYEETQEQGTQASDDSQTPKTGDTKDGMVYVEGFGWVTDEGEGAGTYAGDMYESGNKIGIMD